MKGRSVKTSQVTKETFMSADVTARRHVRKRQRPTIGSARSRAPRTGYGLAEKKRSSTRKPAASTSATTRAAGRTAMWSSCWRPGTAALIRSAQWSRFGV